MSFGGGLTGLGSAVGNVIPDLDLDYENFQDFFRKKDFKMVFLATMLGEYFTLRLQGKTPEVMIGPIPIFNLQNVGHASSDEILKYRSMGGIFLAHQKGGKRTFKITSYLTGPDRFLYFKLFESLVKLGKEQMLNAGEYLTEGNRISWTNAKKSIPDIREEIMEGDPDLFIQPTNQTPEEKYIYHHTFPIISETRIYTSMYLETLRTRRAVELGKDVLEVDLAFRHYESPTSYAKTHNKTTKQVIMDKVAPDVEEAEDAVEKRQAAREAWKDLSPDELNQYEDPDTLNQKSFYAIYKSEKQQRKSKYWKRSVNLLWAGYNTAQVLVNLAEKGKKQALHEGINLASAYASHKALSHVKSKRLG